jgi:hypothetical protein
VSQNLNTSETQVDVSFLASGLYFVVISDGIEIRYRKFIRR